MSKLYKHFALIGLGLFLAVASSQAFQSSQAPSASPNPDGSDQNQAIQRTREACWKQAGLSKETMEQKKTIVSDAKTQIQRVDSDSTLSAAQQKQQIREIRHSMRQQVGKLLTADQQQELKKCREDRPAARNRTATSSPSS